METVYLSHIIANRHLLYMDTKASSSSKLKPPMADELLNYYTKDQLRMHLGEELWDWNNIFEPVSFYIADVESHKLKYLEPRVDFFKKHDCQLVEM